MNPFREFLFVVMISGRLQWAIVLTLLGPLVLLTVGHWYVGSIELHGMMEPLAGPLKRLFLDHYWKEAAVLFFSSTLWCFKVYNRERRRIEKQW